MDVSVVGWPESSGNYQVARQYLALHPEAATYNGAIGPEQRQWLRYQLAEATRAGQHVIVFGHHPVLEATSHSSLLAWNHKEIVKILADAGCVAAYFSGHDHKGGYACQDGIHYVSLQGMVEAPEGSNAYGTVHVYRDRLVIEGTGSLASRTLRFSPYRTNSK